MRRRLALLLAAGLLMAGVPVAVAHAATPQLVVDVEQFGDTGTPVGQEAVFFANVSLRDQNGELVPAPGWPVEISATDGSWTSEPEISDEYGTATFEVTRFQEEEVQVVARVAADGCTPVVSVAIPHSWYDIVLLSNPSGTFRTARGGPATVTATLDRSDRGDVSMRPILFQLFDRGEGTDNVPDLQATVPTDAKGNAVFTWNYRNRDEDELVISEILRDGSVGQTLDLPHTWFSRIGLAPAAPTSSVSAPTESPSGGPETPPPTPVTSAPPIEVQLSVPPGDTRAGQPLVITAEVSLPRPAPGDGAFAPQLAPGRIALAGVPVVLRTADGATATGTTDAIGVATIPLVRTAVGIQNISASVDALGCQVTGDGGPHTWWQPTLTLDPPTATSNVGTTATVTASLARGITPLAGQLVRLTRSMPGPGDIDSTAVTKADGTAVFSWIRTTPGIDHLIASEVTPPIPVFASAVHTWVDVVTPPPTTPTTPTPTTPTPTTPTPTTPTPRTPTPTTTTPTPQITEPPEITDPGSPETSESATASASGTSTATPPPTSPTPIATPTLDTGGVARPGGDVTVSGAGCRAGESVQLRVGDTAFAETRAAADGSFSVRHALPDLSPGQYKVTSTCGSVTGQGVIDVSSPETKGGRAGANGATAASFLLFFTLVGNAAVRFVKGRIG